MSAETTKRDRNVFLFCFCFPYSILFCYCQMYLCDKQREKFSRSEKKKKKKMEINILLDDLQYVHFLACNLKMQKIFHMTAGERYRRKCQGERITSSLAIKKSRENTSLSLQPNVRLLLRLLLLLLLLLHIKCKRCT